MGLIVGKGGELGLHRLTALAPYDSIGGFEICVEIVEPSAV
jgi:hypothetical protein